jgi:head-tail adaptor
MPKEKKRVVSDKRDHSTSNILVSLIMSVDRNIDHRKFEDYVNSIDLWCAANCESGYEVIVSEEESYHIPLEVKVSFEDEQEAAYFKLSYLWSDLVGH